MNNYSFIVDLGKNQKNDKLFNQILICSCGNKQKSKITVKRTILKNTETLYEDKYSIEELVCNNCKKKYDISNNLYGIKLGQKLLIEVKYEQETILLKNNKFDILKKTKLYYYFDVKLDELKKFELIDFLIFDNKARKIKSFTDESLLNHNLLNFNSILESNTSNSNSKQAKFETFDLTKTNFSNNFFSFEETINYKNLEMCFEFFNNLLKKTYDYDLLLKERFLQNFLVSSKIIENTENKNIVYYVNQKDPFGSDKLIKRKLNVGDYLNKLMKFSDITSIFITYSPISTIYKTKGLNFILNAFNKQFFCAESILEYHNGTNTQKIFELCCKYYYRDFNEYKDVHNSNEENYKKEELKFSPLILKSINESDDVLVIYQFYKNQSISKLDIENLFSRFNPENVIKLMSKIVSGSSLNLRNVKLELKHFNHILKNNLHEKNDDWLGIYYDTINTLKLIVELIENKKKNINETKRYKNLKKISENKLFETKNFDKLKELHDEMFAIYRAMEDENKDILFRGVVKKYKNLNSSTDLVEFKIIPNLKELSQEGLIMKHCIYTYLNDIINGNYLAIRVKDTISKEKATMGIKIDKGNLYLQQFKGYENSRPSAFLIEIALKYCKDFEIILDKNHLHKIDIQPNESLEKRMKNYISKSKAIEIRKKMEIN